MPVLVVLATVLCFVCLVWAIGECCNMISDRKNIWQVLMALGCLALCIYVIVGYFAR